MREASLWRLFARGFSSPQGPVQRWARRRLATAEACVAQAVALEVAVRTNSVLQGHANYQSHFQLQSAFLDTLTASCTPKRRAVACPSPKGRADKINFSS